MSDSLVAQKIISTSQTRKSRRHFELRKPTLRNSSPARCTNAQDLAPSK